MSESRNPNARTSSKREEYPENWITVWAKSVGTLLVGIAGLWVSYTVANIQKENSIKDIALKQSTFDLQRKTEELRIAVAAIGFLECNNDLKRASALDLLSTDAPAYFDRFTKLMLNKCASLSVTARTELERAQQQALSRQTAVEFGTRLDNAREYMDRGHDGPAARRFNEASQFIPPALTSKVNMRELEAARSAFASGGFKEAADRFSIAFSQIPDPRQIKR
jgi:hypothetical protein